MLSTAMDVEHAAVTWTESPSRLRALTLQFAIFPWTWLPRMMNPLPYISASGAKEIPLPDRTNTLSHASPGLAQAPSMLAASADTATDDKIQPVKSALTRVRAAMIASFARRENGEPPVIEPSLIMNLRG